MEFWKLPKVDEVLRARALAELESALGRRALTALIRQVIGDFRGRMREGQAAPDVEAVIAAVRETGHQRLKTEMRRVINATGVLLHTNLGRAPLSGRALDAVSRAGAYCSLEFDVELGQRLRRGAAVERSIADLVGAEDALIVNNNAAAVLLCLSSIAAGREVIVSRGELVEIGGGFRIPEVLARSGARLIEVGTTNRTRLGDYSRAMSDQTACLLRVHPSNFKMIGFTERPSLAQLARAAHERDLPLVKDLGGGLIVEDPGAELGHALSGEPSVQSCLKAGADLVCFSLDKLFGGPQGGAVVGSTRHIAPLRSDPLARALRIDKLGLAALEAVVAAYRVGRLDDIVVLARLRVPLTALKERVEGWRAELGDVGVPIRVVATSGQMGGGTLAESPLESHALAIESASADALCAALRKHDPAVIARVENQTVLLDARTVLEGEDAELLRAIRAALGGG